MAARRRAGAPSKLTAALRDELARLLGRGHTINGACGLVGIHKSTYFDWIERGSIERMKLEKGTPLNHEERGYVLFADAVELARDHGEGWLFEQMLEAAEGSASDKHLKRWQAYMTALERSRPDRWRRRAAAEFMQERNAPPAMLTFDPEKLDTEELRQLQTLMAKAAPSEE